jgi:hypothetical protein
MYAYLWLSAALTVGQAETPPTNLAPAAPAAIALQAPPPSVPKPDRWLLMKALQGTWEGAVLDDHRMQVYGWTDASYTASSDEASNLPLAFNYRANQFLLQQNWLRIERAVVTSGTSAPTFGFRNDWILPGSDYFFTLPRGLFNGQLTANHGAPNRHGIDPIQFYLEGYFPTAFQGLDVKFGRIFTQYGVESIAAVDNYFVSHSYADIYDPFTETGIITTTKLNDAWSVQAGLVLGNDDFIDPVDTPYGMGSVKWAPPGGADSVLFSFIAGSGRFNVGRHFHNPEVFDFVYTHQFEPRLTYKNEELYGLTYNVPGIGFANWFSSIHYLSYDFTSRASATTRVEFFDDFQGQRTNFAGLYSAWTVGLQLRPFKWMLVRPELRYDYNGESRPFEDHHYLFTAASDVIMRW